MPYPDNVPRGFLTEKQFPTAERDQATFLALQALTRKVEQDLAKTFQTYLEEVKTLAGKSETPLLRNLSSSLLSELDDYAEYNIILSLTQIWESNFPHSDKQMAELLEESAQEESQP